MSKEVTREEMQKWESLTNFFQYGALAGLFGMIFILEAVDKETARVLVWYLAAFMFTFATIGFFVGRKSADLTSKYFKSSLNRITKI